MIKCLSFPSAIFYLPIRTEVGRCAHLCRIPFHSVLQSPPTFGRADLFGPQSYSARRYARTYASAVQFPVSRALDLPVDSQWIVIILKIVSFFFWICCNFFCGKAIISFTRSVLYVLRIVMRLDAFGMSHVQYLLALKVHLSECFFYKEYL